MPAHTTPDPLTRHPRPLIARIVRSDVTWLAGCVLAVALILQLASVVASRYMPSGMTDRTAPGGGPFEQAGCMREGHPMSRALQSAPPHEGARGNSHVDTGCQEKPQRHGRTAAAPAVAPIDGMRNMAMRKTSRTPNHDARGGRATIRSDGPTAATNAGACKPQRDMALQSHYMLLSLCLIERAPKSGPTDAQRQKKRVLRRPAT